MKQICVKAPATTANVGPGYDIFAMALDEPHDLIKVNLNDTADINIRITGEKWNIPECADDNTAGLALRELIRRKELRCGFDVEIVKQIPSGGGLGTTGASASGAIYAANRLLGLEMKPNELVDIARMGEVASGGSPHADNVAAAMLGGFILVKSYQPMEVLRLSIPAFPIVLAVIRKSQRTTRGFITYEIGQEKLKDQMARCASVIHAIHTGDVEEFGRAVTVDHIAEPVRSAAIPGYAEAKKEILSAGAWGFNVSGGGSSVFALCPDDKQQEIASLMQKHFGGNEHFVKVIATHTSNTGVCEKCGS